MNASEKAALNRCSALEPGRCRNGFKVRPYCIGTLLPERTPKHLWPDCLKED